jgi:hypothetical protein
MFNYLGGSPVAQHKTKTVAKKVVSKTTSNAVKKTLVAAKKTLAAAVKKLPSAVSAKLIKALSTKKNSPLKHLNLAKQKKPRVQVKDMKNFNASRFKELLRRYKLIMRIYANNAIAKGVKVNNISMRPKLTEFHARNLNNLQALRSKFQIQSKRTQNEFNKELLELRTNSNQKTHGLPHSPT